MSKKYICKSIEGKQDEKKWYHETNIKLSSK